MGFELEHYSEPLKVIERVVFGVVAISALLLGYGVGAVLISYIISTSLITIMALWLLRPYISYGRIFAKTTDEFPRSELISFNSMTILLTGLMTSLYHIDVLLLQPLVGSQQTGYYKIALVAAEFLWLAPFALQVVLLHSTSELWMDNRYDKITEMASRATRYGILLTSLLAIGIASLADPFLPLYFGPEYDAAISPLLLLLPGALGFALARPILGIGQGKGNLRVLVIATGIAAFMNVVLNLLLIPRYGMNGAAIATSIGYGSMLLLHVWSAGKLGFNPLYDLRLFRVVLTVVLSAPIIAGLAYVISEDLLALVLVPPCGFVIYLFVAIRTKAIRPAEIRRVATRMPILSERLQ